MAGKGGGGAWKVAYADFVTAMMAFFLVMWICGQDQKLRKAVSHYFNAPFDTSMVGNSKKATRTGATNETNTGAVPLADSVSMGRGRDSHTAAGQPSPATKQVGDWLHSDQKKSDYWYDQARQARFEASKSKEVRDKTDSVDNVAGLNLSLQLRDEFIRNIPPQVQGAYRDLMFEALSKVNWTQLAEDLLQP